MTEHVEKLDYIALSSLQLRIYNLIKKCPIVSYNKIAKVCKCTKEGAIKVVKKLISVGLLIKIRRDYKGYDLSNKYIVKTFKQALGQEPEQQELHFEGLTAESTSVHPYKESTNNNVVVTDKLVKQLRDEIKAATGSMVPERFITKHVLNNKYSLEYVRKKIEVAARSTIEKSVTGFLRRALEDDWKLPEPKIPKATKKQPDNSPDKDRKKEIIRSLYMS